MSDFTLAFEMYRARSFEAYCFDENENPVVPRRTLNGDYHFDHFADRIASVSIVPSNLVTVCATKSRPKGYYEPTVVGNFPDDAPQFQNGPTGVYCWILRQTDRLPVGRFSVFDQGIEFAIRVYGDRPKDRLTLPPSPGLRWIEEFSTLCPPPIVGAWIDRAVRGIGVQHGSK